MRVLGHAMKAPALSGFGLEIVEYIEETGKPSREKQATA
jgi:3,4-dihydroxy 2-butanone 4-phosphate synthase/GTP cyclohydrolase II